MNPYDELIAEADRLYAEGRCKQAHITFGQALSIGTERSDYCRRMRGVASRHVAGERLQLAVDHPDRRQEFLDQAARWLAKSEANLSSAFDEAPETERGHIRLEQAMTEEAMARFMEMSGADPSRRLAAARSYREEGAERLADA